MVNWNHSHLKTGKDEGIEMCDYRIVAIRFPGNSQKITELCPHQIKVK